MRAQTGFHFALTLALILPSIAAQADDAKVVINSAKKVALQNGFSGFNTVYSDTPAQWSDPTLISLTTAANPGVLRWPGGTIDDFFNWKTGIIHLSGDQFKNASMPWTMIDIEQAYFRRFRPVETSSAKPTPTPDPSLPTGAGDPNARGMNAQQRKDALDDADIDPNVKSVGFNTQIDNANKVGAVLIAKGANKLGTYDTTSTGFAGFAKLTKASKLLIVVNIFSDTIESARELAYYVASQKIPVSAFELGNEPQFLIVPTKVVEPGTFPGSKTRGNIPPVMGAISSPQDYLARVAPYYDAIKQGYDKAGVDRSQAVVAINGGYIIPNAGSTSWMGQWDAGLTDYVDNSTAVKAKLVADALAMNPSSTKNSMYFKPGAYWDAVVFHHYPTKYKNDDGTPTDDKNFGNMMKYANDALLNETNKYLSVMSQRSWANGKQILITEYDVTFDDKTMNGSLYGGIFSAEYVMRMSTVPNVMHVAMHELTNDVNGIGSPKTCYKGSDDWKKKYQASGLSAKVDPTTTTPPSGLFANAQLVALGIANAAVNASDSYFPTVVSGGSSVATKSDQMPAVHAQAYHGTDGMMHLVLTNKSAAPISTSVYDGSNIISQAMALSSVSANSASAKNSSSDPQHIAVSRSNVQNPVTLPAYSVVHLSWKPTNGN